MSVSGIDRRAFAFSCPNYDDLPILSLKMLESTHAHVDDTSLTIKGTFVWLAPVPLSLIKLKSVDEHFLCMLK